jgi:hypothetical protein
MRPHIKLSHTRLVLHGGRAESVSPPYERRRKKMAKTNPLGALAAVAGVLKAYLGERWKPQPNPQAR